VRLARIADCRRRNRARFLKHKHSIRDSIREEKYEGQQAFCKVTRAIESKSEPSESSTPHFSGV
jgi:hypothetical protein